MTIYAGQNRIRRDLFLEEMPSSLADVLSSTAEESWLYSPLSSLGRMTEQTEAENIVIRRGEVVPGVPGRSTAEVLEAKKRANPLVSADEARKRIKDSGLDLTVPDEGIREKALSLLMERKAAERRRQDIFNRAPTGFTPTTLRIGTALATTLMDPINVASAFIPVVGEARYASMLARAGSVAGRIGVRARVGALEGAVGAGVVEPLIYAQAQREQADYGLSDSMLNIVFGTVLGGGLHTGAGIIGDIANPGRWRTYRPREGLPRVLDDMSPATREAALRTAVAQSATGRAIDVDPVLRLERDALGRAYDEVLARPIGQADEPTVRIQASDIDTLLMQRGEALERDGEIVVPGRGHGMVKIIWKHGEKSAKGEDLKVTRDDVLALPEVVRQFDPASSKGKFGEEGFKRDWRVQQGGRNVVYAATRWNQADRVVTIHIEDQPLGPMSVERAGGPESPGGIVTPTRDTAEGLPNRLAQGRGTPAPQNIGSVEPVVDAARAQQEPQASRMADFAASDDATVRMAEAPKDQGVEEAQAALADVTEGVQDVAKALGAEEMVKRELEPFVELEKTADAYGAAVRAAALCQLRRGG